MVTITTIGTGKCIWCLDQGDGVQAQFKDGLHGFFCKKHFWQAMQVRGEQAGDDGSATNGVNSTNASNASHASNSPTNVSAGNGSTVRKS